MNRAHQEVGTLRLINRQVRRRRLLGGLFGGGLTAVLAARGRTTARAQGSTPGANEVPAVLQEWAAAWSEHDDGTRLAALYTADGLLFDDRIQRSRQPADAVCRVLMGRPNW